MYINAHAHAAGMGVAGNVDRLASTGGQVEWLNWRTPLRDIWVLEYERQLRVRWIFTPRPRAGKGI